jgi:hypothetical protein
MAKVNFRQQKRQKELARKQRQDERLARRGERVAADQLTADQLAAGHAPAEQGAPPADEPAHGAES